MKPNMQAVAYTIFETPIGPCGLAWNSAGIVAVQLPEASKSATAARLQRRNRGAQPRVPTPQVRRTIAAIQRLLKDGHDDLAGVDLDLSAISPFHRRVFAAARAIPAGQTATYGELAARAGDPAAARAVGQAMARNPFPLIVPCHRVLAAHGRAGGFSAHGGLDTKFRLLRIEGAAIQESLPLG